MKRLLLGAVVAATAALTAAPAMADGVTVQHCYATVIYPCGVCVSEGPVSKCTHG